MKNIYIFIITLLAFSLTLKAQVSEQEFQALKALYNATDGDNWNNRTGWENINTTATKNDVTTGWFGISGIENGHVVQLNMNGNNNLVGTIPPEIGNLQWLTELNISENQLSGTIPGEIGNILSLDYLNLGSNNLSGPLPVSFSALVNLTGLYLSNNPLNCDFPSEILVGLYKIQQLILYRCGLTGTLGNVFETLPNLQGFDITSNHISGEIPQSISQLAQLIDINFSYNMLTGSLPDITASGGNLYSVSFSGNQLTGAIPSGYANLTKLKYLYIDNNQLSGEIPSGLFASVLYRLYMHQNYFTFVGIEPVFNQIKALNDKYFATDKIFPLLQNSFSFNDGDVLILNAAELSEYPLGGNNNRYKWYKDNVEVYSGNNPNYTKGSVSMSDAGIYRFEVTNTVVSGVTLKSDNITVSVVGSNQMPTNIALSTSSVEENFTGTLATLTATDPDAGDTHIFSLATGNGTNDKDNGKFQISGNQLILNSPVNYETTSSLNILITVNDGNGGIFTKAFVITVSNVNEAPVYNGQVTSNTIDENTTNGTTVLTLMAQDPEGSPVTFSILSGNDNGAFGINGDKLIVANNTKLNYDVKSQYSLLVSASDGALSSNATLTVSLNKINQMPKVDNATFTIDENTPTGTVVGTITATDREGDPLTFSILTGNELSAFRFNGNIIEVDNSEALNYEEHPLFNLVINISDGISNVQATVTINLNDVAENTDNSILSFSVPGMVGEAVIDNIAHSVIVKVQDVELTSLVATFTLSSDADSDPVSGTSFDFTIPQTIRVTSQSGSMQEWIVTITKQVGSSLNRNPNLKVYPNPATEYVQIDGLSGLALIKIFTVSGQLVCPGVWGCDICNIDVTYLKSGNYLLLIDSGQHRFIQKFTKY